MTIEGRLVVVNTTGAPEPDNELYSPIVSPERIDKASHYRFRADRVTCLVAEALARRMTSEQLAVANQDLQLGLGANGKPFWPQLRAAGLSCNWSHSKGWVACGLGAGEIGVDIEASRPLQLEEVGDYLHPAEYALLASLNPAGSHLLQLWTMREAYVKYLGVGLLKDPASYRIAEFPASPLIIDRGEVMSGLEVLSIVTADHALAAVAETSLATDYFELDEFEDDLRHWSAIQEIA